jgi:hypothetical protein
MIEGEFYNRFVAQGYGATPAMFEGIFLTQKADQSKFLHFVTNRLGGCAREGHKLFCRHPLSLSSQSLQYRCSRTAGKPTCSI